MSAERMRRILIVIIGLSLVVIGAMVVSGFAAIIQKNDGSLACVYLALIIAPVWLVMFWGRGRMVSRMARGRQNITLSGYRRDTRRDD